MRAIIIKGTTINLDKMFVVTRYDGDHDEDASKHTFIMRVRPTNC